ncbi:MAG: hypothetical protein EBU98_07570, partial [Actinobacteria bacterium]|nr:hypothetical protein [Actinomycetota bacterium]
MDVGVSIAQIESRHRRNLNRVTFGDESLDFPHARAITQLAIDKLLEDYSHDESHDDNEGEGDAVEV